MLKWLAITAQTFRSALKSRRDLALENLALRQQLAVLKQRLPRPQLTHGDRLFWVLMSRLWALWRSTLHLVQPATVVRWHRQGFRYYWRFKSRRRGRPKIDLEIRQLVQRMCRGNPLWGAPRIHGELLKLGIDVSEATVSKYMIRRQGPPSQTWRTFLKDHASETIAMDFFTVPTATFRVLFVLIILNHDRRRILHFNATEHPSAQWTARQVLEACGTDCTPRFVLRDNDSIYGMGFRRQVAALDIDEVTAAPYSPWQNPYVEPVIGSVRRECLNHMIILGPRPLKKILAKYVDYYHKSRTHLSLDKDTPDSRAIHHLGQGRVIELKRVYGLHHEYVRKAA